MGDHPASMHLSADSDSVLLFKREDFKGDCIFRRKSQQIPDLGSGKDGGKAGFGNSVTSVRIDPFTVRLNVSIVSNEDGRLPGYWSSEARAEEGVADFVAMANTKLTTEQALLALEIGRCTVRADNRKFDLNRTQTKAFPDDWKVPGMIDLIVVNSFVKTGVVGKGRLPGLGQVAIVATTWNDQTEFDSDALALILLHEVGHYLGLSHGTSAKDELNIMGPEGRVDGWGRAADADGNLNFADRSFTCEQIEEMHNKLSTNLWRKGDRHG